MPRNAKFPIPTFDTSPSMRKVSRTHLDTLFNALVLILNLNELKVITPDLISILNSMHHRLISALDLDAVGTIKLYKALSAWFLEYLRGNRLPRGDIPHSDWSVSHNCPNLFIDLLPWLAKHLLLEWQKSDKHLLHIQVIYALLSSHRVVVTPMRVDTSTITADGLPVPDYSAHFKAALENIGVTPTEFQSVFSSMCANAKLRIVSTAGPNGQATWTAHEDSVALRDSPSVFKSFKAFADTSGLSWIFNLMVGCIDSPSVLKQRLDHVDPVAGRIHAIEEWGGKTRLVAIMDYWTQALLTPLHDTIAFFLKRLDQDGTFDQTKIIDKVKAWSGDPNKSVYSFDLTAATDRLPLEFQRQILSFLLGDSALSSHWATLMSGREFLAPDGSLIKYARGQPMGAKSSFPMLGLAHHTIVQICALMAKTSKYSDYVILGDDCTLTNDEVSVKYQQMMASLAIPLNLSKSIVHKTGTLSAGEICKRIFIEGKEITAIPVKLIVKAQKHGSMLSDLQNVFSMRGWPGLKDNFLQFCSGLSDPRSLRALVLLNAFPKSVSGLNDPVDVSNIISIEKMWSDSITFTSDQLEQAYTYALVTEQLKRVDSLLKGTQIMAETIALKSKPDVGTIWPSYLFDQATAEEKAKALAAMPTINPSHPIMVAAQYEHDRVMSHLTALRAGSPAMVAKARGGLLDILRNSLHEIWLGEPERAGIIGRSLFNATLATIKHLVDMKVTDGKERAVNFSLLISYVQRMWTVNWTFNSLVRINAVKSKVNINVTETKTRLDKLFDKVSAKDIRI